MALLGPTVIWFVICLTKSRACAKLVLPRLPESSSAKTMSRLHPGNIHKGEVSIFRLLCLRIYNCVRFATKLIGKSGGMLHSFMFARKRF